MKKVKNLVIGAGFSGLTLANQLDDVTILSKEVGGLIGSVKRNGFTFDLGGHVYTTSDPRITAIMKESDGVLHEKRKAFYLADPAKGLSGVWADYPVQTSFAHMVHPQRQKQFQFNLEDFAMNTFGEEFVEFFFRPFNQRVWSTKLSEMDFDWIEGRVQMPKDLGSSWGSNASFYYAPGEKIIQTLTNRVSHVGMVKGDLFSIDPESKTIEYLAWDGGAYVKNELQYENLFDTSGYFVKHLSRSFSVVIGLGFENKLDLDFHWIYPHVTKIVHRVTLLSRYHPSLAPSGTDSLLLEIPFGSQKTLPTLINYISGLDSGNGRYGALETLVEAQLGLDLEGHKIAEVFVTWIPAYPVPVVGSRSMIGRLKQDLLIHDIYLAGRWGAHGYWNLDHLITDADTVMAQFAFDDLHERYLTSSFYYKKEVRA